MSSPWPGPACRAPPAQDRQPAAGRVSVLAPQSGQGRRLPRPPGSGQIRGQGAHSVPGSTSPQLGPLQTQQEVHAHQACSWTPGTGQPTGAPLWCTGTRPPRASGLPLSSPREDSPLTPHCVTGPAHCCSWGCLPDPVHLSCAAAPLTAALTAARWALEHPAAVPREVHLSPLLYGRDLGLSLSHTSRGLAGSEGQHAQLFHDLPHPRARKPAAPGVPGPSRACMGAGRRSRGQPPHPCPA